MSAIVEVLLPNRFDHGFDYALPEGREAPVGSIVSVPFAKTQSLGVVWGVGRGNLDPAKIKPIAEICDAFPPLTEAFRKFLSWAAWYNGASLGQIMKMVLPVAEIMKQGRLGPISVARMPDHFISDTELSLPQKDAVTNIVQHCDKGFHISLLDGVTGSGKTEVYFSVIAELLQKQARTGKQHSQILVLLPEIALSVQWLARFEKHFGVTPVLWHSNVTPARRRAAWQAIATGEAQVIVGARSALFLPYRNLSLIVVDEEHDGSYKQEEGVIYHARDMAIARAQHEQFPVLLVSATPSLESVHNVQVGKYTEVTLPMRHAQAVMPEVHLLDMRAEPLERDCFISQPLRQAIADALQQGHQAMLFLNRRGYAPLVLCRHCGHRFQCPHCSAWLVMHADKKQHWRLHCHHCDYHIALPPACPECHSEQTLHACGPGVERICEEIQALLPQARVATLASDATTSQQEVTRIIQQMESQELDILIGTQMIAKGYHFSRLTVVGVVDADLGLAGGDLRAAEKTYQLLHQISGRAGREEMAGHVYLQSYLPDHPVMQALAAGTRDAFFTAELEARRQAEMPPFSRLAALIIEGTKEDEVLQVSRLLARASQPPAEMMVYGPAPAPLYRLRNHYRYRFLIKAPRSVNLPSYMRRWVSEVSLPRSIRVKIDVDPMSFM